MKRRFVARSAAALMLLALAAAALGVVWTESRGGAREPRVELTRASKALRIHASGRGRALVEGLNLAPGDRRRGSVSVGVSARSRVAVAVDRVVATPTAQGSGTLADALRVRMTVIGGGSRSFDVVYDGPLTGLGERRLGRWRAGERYRFRIRVSFPSTAGSQDRLQGARTSFRFVWRAGP